MALPGISAPRASQVRRSELGIDSRMRPRKGSHPLHRSTPHVRGWRQHQIDLDHGLFGRRTATLYLRERGFHADAASGSAGELRIRFLSEDGGSRARLGRAAVPRRDTMDFEKYTDRAKGFVQSAQSLALREGHQQFGPDHLLKVLLDDPEGMAAGLIQRAGGQPGDALTAVERALAQAARRCRAAAPARSTWRPSWRACSTPPRRSPTRPATSSSPSSACCWRWRMEQSDAARVLKDAGVNPTSAEPGHQRHPQGPHRRQRLGRAGLRRAEALRPRPDRAGRRGQDRSRDRPRRGDPPHHPGAVPAHQEQPRADRRARRRQDRHRRRAWPSASSRATCPRA